MLSALPFGRTREMRSAEIARLQNKSTPVMNARRGLHAWGFERKRADGLLRRFSSADFFLKIREGFSEEKRRDNRAEEMVEPIRLVQAERLERRFIENEVRTGRHVP